MLTIWSSSSTTRQPSADAQNSATVRGSCASIVIVAILLVMALFPSTPVGFGMGFVFGGAFVATFLGGITIIQERVHDSLRGRAFALAHSGLRVSAVTLGVLAAWGAKMLGSQQRAFAGFHMDGTQIVFCGAGLLLVVAATALLRPATARAAA